jgi:hypothetical protein
MVHTSFDLLAVFIDKLYRMDLTPITLTHKFPMATVVEIFRKMGPRYAIITKYGKLHGLITRKDVLRHLAFMHRFEVKEGAETSSGHEKRSAKSGGDYELIEQGRAML